MMRVAGCIVEYNEKILLLHRIKKNSAVWGFPAGAVSDNEEVTDAAIRELREETGIEATEYNLEFIGTWPLSSDNASDTFSAFRLKLTKNPTVVLSPKEHDAFMWIDPKECAQYETINNLLQILTDLHYI